MIFKSKAIALRNYQGMRAFLWVWGGQLFSTIGTQLTLFALGVTVYQQSQSVLQFAWILVVIYLPPILLSPLAGYLADHFPRRWLMIISDTGAIAGTLMASGLLLRGNTQSWEIYTLLGISSAFDSLQFPAYLAATTLMVPKTFLSRANGLITLGHSLAQLVAPFTAGWLLLSVKLPGIILLDCTSFTLLLLILLRVKFPELAIKINSAQEFSYAHLLTETKKGWQYITQRSDLTILALLMGINFATLGVIEVLFTPFVLSFATVKELGILLSIGGGGIFLGSLITIFWRSPSHRGKTILESLKIQGWTLFGSAGEWTINTFPVFVGGILAYCLVSPIIWSFNQSLWQERVEVTVQGQVFATRLAIEWSCRLAAILMAAWLTDVVFEPLFQGHNLLVDLLDWYTGRGPGRGIVYLWSYVGGINVVAAMAAYRSPLLDLD